jgi:NTP pyrophosphatase (non-canonical NTP hydrolase)
MQSRLYKAKSTKRLSIVGEGFHSERLLTAAVGLCAEAGEFTEIIKKIVFQGKPVNEDNLFHLKREMGDIMWYFMQACMALDVSPEEIIEMNVDKLKSRYPGGEFDVHYSENRKEGDV